MTRIVRINPGQLLALPHGAQADRPLRRQGHPGTCANGADVLANAVLRLAGRP